MCIRDRVESAPRVALPASHPLINASSLTLEQLADYPYIYFDPVSYTHLGVLARDGAKHRAIRQSTPDRTRENPDRKR